MDNKYDIFECMKLMKETAQSEQMLRDEITHNPKLLDMFGRKYFFDHKSCAFVEIEEPEYYPETFRPFTLDGLVEWIKADTDKLFVKENPPALVVVENEKRVIVLSHAKTKKAKRITYAMCQYQNPDIPFGRYTDSEMWNVVLQSSFIQDENRDLLLSVINNVTEDQSMNVSDDGFSQRVTVTSGVAEIKQVAFRNPAILRPMRTFTEIYQPASPFVVRFKEGKQVGLFEADGGKWKVDAVMSIGHYLKTKLFDENVIVIA